MAENVPENLIDATAGRSFDEACVDAKLSLFARGVDLESAHLLAYYPAVHRNPYQQMMYSAAFDEGFACFPVKDLSEVAEPPVKAPFGVHYHWVHRVFAGASNGREAGRAAQAFLDTVDQHKELGLKVLWTVHNLLSHSARFVDEEIKLRAGLSERADFVHIMNPATVEICARYYQLNAQKTLLVPHPSYFGVYGDYITAEQARFDLGITPEDKTVLLFGSLGAHKGTRQFLRELDDLQNTLGVRLRVLIAGQPADPAYMEEIYGLVAGKANVSLLERHIDDQTVQTLFRATDIVVCPYDIGLNSGVAATAATFGRPCVVPDILVPAMSGVGTGVIGFNPSRRESLATAIGAALEAGSNPEIETSLIHWAEIHRPRAISKAFFAALRERW